MAEGNKKYCSETLQLHVGQEQADPAIDSRAVPIYAAINCVFHNLDYAEARFSLVDPGNIYGCLINTTQSTFEDRITVLEGGTVGLTVAPGAAVVEYAVRNIAQSGNRIAVAKNIYDGTFSLLRHTLSHDGTTTIFVSAENPQKLGDAIQENTKLVHFETFGNPNASLSNFEAISEIIHKHHLPVIVDNTSAISYLFCPLEHGADVVAESVTKFIGDHGTTLSGMIVEGGKFSQAEIPGKFPILTEPDPSYYGLNFCEALGGTAPVTCVRVIPLRDTGATLSPFVVFPLLQGTETLSLRVERHVQDALKVVEYLQTVPEVESVPHPSTLGRSDHDLYKKYFPNGTGSIFTFDIEGGKDVACVFIGNPYLFSLPVNVADAKPLVIRPASATHSQETLEESEDQGIHQSTICLSTGIEDIEDTLDDPKGGFEALRAFGLVK